MQLPSQDMRDRWSKAVHRAVRETQEAEFRKTGLPSFCMESWLAGDPCEKRMGLGSYMKPLIEKTRGVLENAIEYQRKLNERAAARAEKKAEEQRARERRERDAAAPPVEPPAVPPEETAQPLPEQDEAAECVGYAQDEPPQPEPQPTTESEAPPRRPPCFTFTSRF